jgi:hypothetical protein
MPRRRVTRRLADHLQRHRQSASSARAGGTSFGVLMRQTGCFSNGSAPARTSRTHRPREQTRDERWIKRAVTDVQLVGRRNA